MKKWIIATALFMLCCISACSNKTEIPDNVNLDENAEGEEEETTVDIINKTILAEALGIEEDSRNIRFILRNLNTVGAGQIQSAEAAEENGENVLNIVSEDGTNFRIYLSRSGSVEAIENLDTGEWPVQSQK